MKLRVSVGVLILLGLSAVFADFLAPYDPAEQNRELPLHQPSRLVVAGLRPAVQEADGQTYPIRFFARGPRYRLLGLFPCERHLFEAPEPARVFLLGSDDFGRDQFSRLLHGGRVSLFAGALATLLALGVGLMFGVVAGFYGGAADEVLMRAVDLSLSLPWLYLLVGIRAFLPLTLSPATTLAVLIGVMGVIGWARPARMIRGVVLSAKEREYVYAARGFGASDVWLLRRHILPDTWSPLLVQASLLIPQFILAEVTMSFFGLGIGEPATSWGTLLSPLRQIPTMMSAWWLAIPALLLLPAFMTFHVCADELQRRASRRQEG